MRPTSDRVREAVFNILGDLHGACVLDLFAGTGAMGLEALSRGAVQATFVEIDRQALDVVRRNVDATVTTEDIETELIKGDAARVARSLALDEQRYDLIFFDPPYERTEEMVAQLSGSLPQLFDADTRVVLELATRYKHLIEVAAEAWERQIITSRTYGDTAVAVLGEPD